LPKKKKRTPDKKKNKPAPSGCLAATTTRDYNPIASPLHAPTKQNNLLTYTKETRRSKGNHSDSALQSVA
jgi:hypothetical protein